VQQLVAAVVVVAIMTTVAFMMAAVGSKTILEEMPQLKARMSAKMMYSQDGQLLSSQLSVLQLLPVSSFWLYS